MKRIMNCESEPFSDLLAEEEESGLSAKKCVRSAKDLRRSAKKFGCLAKMPAVSQKEAKMIFRRSNL